MQVDTEDEVSYASISFKKKTNGEARVRCLLGDTGVFRDSMK